MNCKWCKAVLCRVVPVLIFGALPVATFAQFFDGIGQWEIIAELGVDVSNEKTRFHGSTDLTIGRTRYQEGLIFRNRMSIYDPRLATVNTNLTVTLFQDRLTSRDSNTASDGDLLNYDVSTDLFASKPFSVLLFGNRGEGTITREFAGSTNVLVANRGVSLRIRKWFPSTLTYRQEQLDERTLFDGAFGRRAQDRDILSFDGRARWERHDLNVRFELGKIDDLVLTEQSYDTTTASLSHRLRLDKGGRRSLQSTVRSSSRAGRSNFDSVNINESLTLVHTAKLRTSYEYTLSRFTTDRDESTTRTGGVFLHHQLYDSLATDISARRSTSEFIAGEESLSGGRVDFNHTKNIGWGGKLITRLGGYVEDRESNMLDEEAQITNESHTAEIGAPFRLDRARVVPGSIVVMDPTRTTLFEEGLDYLERFIGTLVEIEILPGGRIVDGSVLTIDYGVAVSPSSDVSTRSIRFSVGADYDWINPYYSVDRVREKLVSGTDAEFLDNPRSETVGVRLKWKKGGARGQFTNELRTHEANTLSYEILQFGQLLSWTPSGRANTTLTLRETFTDFGRPDRETRNLLARFTAVWKPWRSLIVEGSVSARNWTDTLASDETFYTSRVQGRWSVGDLVVTPSLSFDIRVRDSARSRDTRMSLLVTRRF